jgi:hypothetical protein
MVLELLDDVLPTYSIGPELKAPPSEFIKLSLNITSTPTTTPITALHLSRLAC